MQTVHIPCLSLLNIWLCLCKIYQCLSFEFFFSDKLSLKGGVLFFRNTPITFIQSHPEADTVCWCAMEWLGLRSLLEGTSVVETASIVFLGEDFPTNTYPADPGSGLNWWPPSHLPVTSSPLYPVGRHCIMAMVLFRINCSKGGSEGGRNCRLNLGQEIPSGLILLWQQA